MQDGLDIETLLKSKDAEIELLRELLRHARGVIQYRLDETPPPWSTQDKRDEKVVRAIDIALGEGE